MPHRFNYITSFDELTWVTDWTTAHIVRCDIDWEARPEVLDWIQTCLEGQVSCWNGTSGVGPTDKDTIRNIVPRNETCYMIFDNQRDLEMFLLRYSDRFDAKYFGNSMSKAWQDSRKI